jgi:hypothetical protein
MGYNFCTSEVQIFLRYKPFKWGTVPQNGVQMATLSVTQKASLQLEHSMVDRTCTSFVLQ